MTPALRSSLAFLLSGTLALSQVPVTAPKPTPVNTLSDEQLWDYIALDGTMAPEETGRLKDFNLALGQLFKRASEGDGLAACFYGMEAEAPSLKGRAPDYPLAAQWYAFSEKNNEPCGYYHYGRLLLSGKGVPKDVHEGIHRVWANPAYNYPEKESRHYKQVEAAKARIEAALHPKPVPTPTADSSSDSVGGALLLGLGILAGVALLSGDGDKKADKTDNQEQATPEPARGCWVKDPYFDEEAGYTKYRSRYEYPCNH